MSPEKIVTYLKDHDLYLTTAESCTAGRIVAMLAEVPQCGEILESGYVVYSPHAKQRLLGVSMHTVEQFNLTSVEVAREMAVGALRDSPANVVIATTGLCGGEDVDGIPAGTVCFAWGFLHGGRQAVFTRRRRFFGDRHALQTQAALYALEQLPAFHRRMLAGESA
ncbi:CinA family protein [Pseudomonas sp. DTU_2021_1001937_2_SI_NGA_ILE_001]|uniref:CinA family protein n=1 Tax=Pseudomonas sp. DTU_2021_1001937_2_SI_NGA_ILE_001 TaxID=3077589 RepID=UPI0028FC11A9|nr:CinA family protein [Pseudomonas sp. DTU_2021_1001937_2_SI_NGA_ILE_001]WNW10280.1 CinA family protein [Pseudomonas sp. DTU_2021_1001937_2_SI_NGA_ILE_001]